MTFCTLWTPEHFAHFAHLLEYLGLIQKFFRNFSFPGHEPDRINGKLVHFFDISILSSSARPYQWKAYPGVIHTLCFGWVFQKPVCSTSGVTTSKNSKIDDWMSFPFTIINFWWMSLPAIRSSSRPETCQWGWTRTIRSAVWPVQIGSPTVLPSRLPCLSQKWILTESLSINQIV